MYRKPKSVCWFNKYSKPQQTGLSGDSFLLSSQKLSLSDSFQVQSEFYLYQTPKNKFEKCQFIISSSQSIKSESKTPQPHLGLEYEWFYWIPKNARRIPSIPSKSRKRVLYNFQCYEKLHSNCWAAKARCTPTSFAMKVLLGS